jgi:hypothetical protein
MAISFGSPIDLTKLELQNARIQNLAAAPASPVAGQLYFNTGDGNLYVYDGSSWVDLTAQGVSYSAGSGISISGTTIAADTGTSSTTVAAGNDARFPTSDEKAALAGTNGSPSTSNRYVTNTDARLTDARPLAAPSSSVSLNGQKLVDVAAGTSSTDAVNKGQLDAAQAGLDVRPSVRAATTADVTVATALATGQVLDGVTLSDGDRVLVKNQSTASENGIYVAGTSPARAGDGLSGGTFVFVEEGTTQADTGWVITTNGSITPGTTSHTWAVFSRAGELSAGDGLTKTGGTLAVDSSVARLTGATFTGAVTVPTPSSSGHAATKGYVDGLSSGGGYATTVGNGSATTITVTHNLATRDVLVEVYRNSGNYDTVLCEVRRTSTNAVDLVFGTAPSSNEYRVVVRA